MSGEFLVLVLVLGLGFGFWTRLLVRLAWVHHRAIAEGRLPSSPGGGGRGRIWIGAAMLWIVGPVVLAIALSALGRVGTWLMAGGA
jgi:hypothetical protein